MWVADLSQGTGLGRTGPRSDDSEAARVGAERAGHAGGRWGGGRAAEAASVAGDGARGGALGAARVPGGGVVAQARAARCAIGVFVCAGARLECSRQVHVVGCEFGEDDRGFPRLPELPGASRFVGSALSSIPS